jgi:hypothetical protein
MNSLRKSLVSLPGRRLSRFEQANNRDNIEALRQIIQSSPDTEWQQFTPAPVLEPNCYVEVQVVSPSNKLLS